MDERNTLGEVADLVCSQVPGSRVCHQPAADVEANYRVSFTKIRDQLGFRPRRRLEEGIAEVRDALLGGEVEDYLAERYSNHKSLMAAAMPLPR